MEGVPRIKEVKPLENMVLLVIFEGNVKKIYNVKPLLNKFNVFTKLKNKEIFNLVRVDTGGYGVVWNDEIDLSEYEIWNNSVTCEEERN